jgi:hypothetical protein
MAVFARDSLEAKSLVALHEIAGVGQGFRQIHVRTDGVSWRSPITPQLLALSSLPPPADWVTLTRQQAGAWEALLRDTIAIQVRRHCAKAIARHGRGRPARTASFTPPRPARRKPD